MSLMQHFKDEATTDVVITKPGGVTGVDDYGRPVYAADVELYNGKAAFWLLSSDEVYRLDRINNPSTHALALFPDLITGEITPDAVATIDGKTYRIYPGEDPFNEGDPYYTVVQDG